MHTSYQTISKRYLCRHTYRERERTLSFGVFWEACMRIIIIIIFDKNILVAVVLMQKPSLSSVLPVSLFKPFPVFKSNSLPLPCQIKLYSQKGGPLFLMPLYYRAHVFRKERFPKALVFSSVATLQQPTTTGTSPYSSSPPLQAQQSKIRLLLCVHWIYMNSLSLCLRHEEEKCRIPSLLRNEMVFHNSLSLHWQQHTFFGRKCAFDLFRSPSWTILHTSLDSLFVGRLKPFKRKLDSSIQHNFQEISQSHIKNVTLSLPRIKPEMICLRCATNMSAMQEQQGEIQMRLVVCTHVIIIHPLTRASFTFCIRVAHTHWEVSWEPNEVWTLLHWNTFFILIFYYRERCSISISFSSLTKHTTRISFLSF